MKVRRSFLCSLSLSLSISTPLSSSLSASVFLLYTFYFPPFKALYLEMSTIASKLSLFETCRMQEKANIEINNI